MTGADGSQSSAERYLEILMWLNEEAAMLDDGRFDEWLALLDDEVTYEMPVRLTRERGDSPDVSFGNLNFKDDRTTLELRIRRLDTDFAWAEDPPSRTRRFVTNVRIAEGSSGDELRVLSYILLYRNRGDESTVDLLAGKRTDLLRRSGDGWRLRERVIVLDQAAVGTKNLALLM